MTVYGAHEHLWQTWLDERSKPARDALIVAYQPLVRTLASGIARSTRVEVDELISHGQLGLVDAIERFDPSMNVKFDIWGSQRVKGAIFDGIRAFDPAPKRRRLEVKALGRAAETARHRFGREPTDQEVAGVLGVQESTVHRLRTQELLLEPAKSLSSASEPEYPTTGGLTALASEVGPEDHASVNELRDTVGAAFAAVTGPERVVIGLYYFEGLRMADIGRLLGVSAATVSKMHAKAMVQVRDRIEDMGSAWA